MPCVIDAMTSNTVIANTMISLDSMAHPVIGALLTALLVTLGGCDPGTERIGTTGYRISGNVLTSGGAPVSGAEVEVLSFDVANGGCERGRKVYDDVGSITESDGRFTFTPSGPYGKNLVCSEVTVRPPEGLEGPKVKQVEVEVRDEKPYDEKTVGFVLDSTKTK
ncbi:carboxypeptidase-like regulatory domain-containing protein [Salinibacter ruber]|uniref:carboxypeptidase-like regulatory domain-containing protein n=1 Tax=Salinibacter ruber TaxID=146919 RepID=UPI00216851BD|nr:carboxypeptidase-like regulatory domain-containing protein [Salinibacter ruber]MCS3698559.1 hypothetical protein [Salinibacter ruber]